MPTPTPLAGVTPTMQEPLRDFANLLRDLAGDGVKSLTLYGAIAAGSFDASRHTAHSVLVVSGVDLAVLRRIAEQGPRFGKQRISAPLIMTPTYIAASRDTFPLELLDIQQNHIVVFGEDYFTDLEFDGADIRRQCERELKVQAMSLRQGLLAAAGRDKVLGEILKGVNENLLRIMRGMLWLKDRREPQAGKRVVEEIEQIVGRKLPGVRATLLAADTPGWPEFENLYRDIEALGEIVDAW